MFFRDHQGGRTLVQNERLPRNQTFYVGSYPLQGMLVGSAAPSVNRPILGGSFFFIPMCGVIFIPCTSLCCDQLLEITNCISWIGLDSDLFTKSIVDDNLDHTKEITL